jgi:hypothetical protein
VGVFVKREFIMLLRLNHNKPKAVKKAIGINLSVLLSESLKLLYI